MRSQILLALLLRFSAVVPFPLEIGFHGGRDQHYQWVRAIESGKGKEETQWVKGTWPRHLPIVARDSFLYMLGERHLWYSADGVNWARAAHNGTFGKRYGSSLIFWSGKFWLFGGMKTWEKFENDIWSSPDGLRWTKEHSNAPWAPRRGHAVLEYENKLWLIGGVESSRKKNALPIRSLGDVWVSRDGKAWVQVIGHAEWSGRFPEGYFRSSLPALIFNNRFVVLGPPGSKSVWISLNGATWEKISECPSFEGRAAVVFNGTLWLLGGVQRSEVWHSEDAVTWNRFADGIPWSGRSPWNPVAFLDKLWIFGGKTGRTGDRGDDVWYLEHSESVVRKKQ